MKYIQIILSILILSIISSCGNGYSKLKMQELSGVDRFTRGWSEAEIDELFNQMEAWCTIQNSKIDKIIQEKTPEKRKSMSQDYLEGLEKDSPNSEEAMVSRCIIILKTLADMPKYRRMLTDEQYIRQEEVFDLYDRFHNRTYLIKEFANK